MKQLNRNEKIAVVVAVVLFVFGFFYFWTDLFTGSAMSPADVVYID